MTDNGIQPTTIIDPDDIGPLPLVVRLGTDQLSRAPSQRVLDLIARFERVSEGITVFRDQPTRVAAFRHLLIEHPHRDANSLWLHAYDVEVDVFEVTPDPTSSGTTTTAPPSAVTGD